MILKEKLKQNYNADLIDELYELNDRVLAGKCEGLKITFRLFLSTTVSLELPMYVDFTIPENDYNRLVGRLKNEQTATTT